MKHTAEDVAFAREFLTKVLSENPNIYTVCTNVSRSGMQRRYMVLAVSNERGTIERISWAVAQVTTMRLNRDEQSIAIGGCGFSAPQEIASTLGRALGLEIAYREL